MNPKQTLLFILGCIAVALGAMGIILPILPTTPFVIAAAICFSGSSPRMYAWLSSSKYFGEFIKNYREGTGVSKRTKIYSLIFLWSLLCVSMYFMRNNIIILIALVIVGLCVTTHILMLKSNMDNDNAQSS